MNQTFEIETGKYLTLFGLVGSSVLAAWLLTSSLRGWRAIRGSRRISNPPETAKSWKIVKKYTARQVLGRFILSLGALVIAGLFWFNGFVWFSSVQVSETSVLLGFALGSSRSLTGSEIEKIQDVSERRQGSHLEIVTVNGKSFRSVRMTDSTVLLQIESAMKGK